MRAAAWYVAVAAGSCIDPIFMPKIAFGAQEWRMNGLKDRIVP
jgi:hypothetical protein